jgi:hypothetical protein
MKKEIPAGNKGKGIKALKAKSPEVAAKMGYGKGGKVKKGYHMMPDSKMMKGARHKK